MSRADEIRIVIKRVIVIDANVVGLAHIPVNTGVLSAIVRSNVFDEICFYAERGHRDAVIGALEQANRSRISGWSVNWSPWGGRKGVIDWSLIRLLLHSIVDPNSIIIMLSSGRSTIFSLLFASLIRPIKLSRTFSIFHATVADLWWPRSRNPLKRAVDLYSAVHLLSRGGGMVFLEAGIRQEFVTRFPYMTNLTRLWPHPLPQVPRGLRKQDARTDRGPRFGFLGWASSEKGFDHFLEMAAESARERPGTASFHAVGHTAHAGIEEGSGKYRYLSTLPRPSLWPREEFLEAARGMDYICLFYNDTYYKYVASGVLMDALALGIPVIAPDIPLVSSLFDQFGTIGFLYGGHQNRLSVIKDAVTAFRSTEYIEMKKNITLAAGARSADSLAALIGRDLRMCLEESR